jgi:hypothetical protein
MLPPSLIGVMLSGYFPYKIKIGLSLRDYPRIWVTLARYSHSVELSTS